MWQSAATSVTEMILGSDLEKLRLDVLLTEVRGTRGASESLGRLRFLGWVGKGRHDFEA